MSVRSALLEILSTSSTNFLNDVQSSAWKLRWHASSESKANRINAYLEVPSVRDNDQLLLVLMLLILKSTAKSYKEAVVNKFIDHAIFQGSYKNVVKERSQMGKPIDKFDICLSIVLENISTDITSETAKAAFDKLLKDFESYSEFSTESLINLSNPPK